MAKFIRAADTIRAAFGCAVLIVRDCGIKSDRPRGRTNLSGADDAQISNRDKPPSTLVVTARNMSGWDSFGIRETFRARA
jgi:hypothetical protein